MTKPKASPAARERAAVARKWGQTVVRNSDLGIGRPSGGADTPHRKIYAALGASPGNDLGWMPSRYEREIFLNFMWAKLFARYAITPLPKTPPDIVLAWRERRFARHLRLLRRRRPRASNEDLTRAATDEEFASYQAFGAWRQGRLEAELVRFSGIPEYRLWWAETWSPSASDWQRLTFLLAVQHNEPGFLYSVEAATGEGKFRYEQAVSVSDRDDEVRRQLGAGKTMQDAAKVAARKFDKSPASVERTFRKRILEPGARSPLFARLSRTAQLTAEGTASVQDGLFVPPPTRSTRNPR